jgi:hypothetical protein
MKNEKIKIFLMGFFIGMVFTLIIIRIVDIYMYEKNIENESFNDMELIMEDQIENIEMSTDSADSEFFESQ